MRLVGAPLGAVGALLVAAGPGMAQERVWERSAAALARAEAAPAEAASLLRASLRELERRDAARQREFSEAASRPLPAKAAQRLERARAAYQAGHGRLLDVLRQTVDGAPAAGTRPGLLREARQIVARIEETARREPVSADDLPVGAPALTPPTLGVASGTASTVPIGPVPQTLKDAADALPGVVEVYEWVRNALAPEFYYGVMKGDVQTYLEQAGNDADTASVLVQMLRAKGVPARYVRGTVEVRGPTLARVVGTANVEQAVRVLERAGIPHEAVLGAGGVASVKLERVWTEAYLPYANYRGVIFDGQGRVWLPLDAAFKPLAPPSGMDVVGDLGFEPQAAWEDYLAATQTATPLEFVRGRVEQLLETRPGTSYDSTLNRRVFGAEVHGLLPNTLPYKVVSVTEVGYDLPDALVHTLRLTADRDGAPLLDATLPVRDVLPRRLTLSYEPATEEDAEVVASYGSVTTTPPYLFEVKPILRSGGVEIAAGTPIGMGVSFALRMELTTPGGSRVVTNAALAGNTTAVGLGGRETTAAEEGSGTEAEILAGIAQGYWRSWNDTDDELADLLKVVPLRPTVSACLVGSAVEVEYAGGDPLYPVLYEWKGLLIDADLRSSAPVGLDSRESEGPFLLLSGLQGSILENRVFETRHDVEAVSTAKALGLAGSQGIAVHDLTSANVDEVLAALPFDAAVKAEVRDAVARGFGVRIPAQPVTHLAWTGVGYVVTDAVTSAAAYQLQGGHSGGVTAPSVADFPAELRDALEIREGEPKQDENRGVARLQKFQSTDFQIGTVNKQLARPLRVLVTDGDGFPLANSSVTFSVIGGGGALVSPRGGTHAEVDVRSNEDGVAQVALLLGQRTDVIPRFLLPEQGQEHATQVGLNLVTARAELARLDEPFMALGLPDDQRDPQSGRSFAALTLRGGADAGWSANLRVATRLSVGAEDPYGNPLSNFPIRVAYRPLPVPATVPGYTSLRDATDSPGGVLGPPDFERCVAATPVVAKGTCAGEAVEVVVRSSALGAFTYPVLGGSPLSLYYFDVGTVLTPHVFWIAYPTTGPACYAATREPCGEAGTRPDGWPSAGTRAVLVNTLGNLVEAYPPGGAATAGLWTDVVYERERIVNRRDEETGTDHFFAEGTNEWVREPLDNSQFELAPVTAGTAVAASASSVGHGQYEAPVTMSPAPSLNTIEWEATMRPNLVPYLPFVSGQTLPGEVDPRYVDNSNPAAPRLRERVIDPNRTWSSRGTFSLWGARAHLSSIDPAPIFLRENLTTAHDSSVRFSIEPPAFALELLPVQVLFELRRGAESILTANGSTREPDGTFRIPADHPLAEGQYTAVLSLLGVAGRTAQALVSQPVPVEAGIVTLTVDTNNDTIVDDADDEAFRKDPSRAFAFWEADPEAEGLRTLEDYATLRVRVPFALPSNQSLALTLVGSQWILKKKVVSEKDYLSNPDEAQRQLASLDDTDGQPLPRGSDQFEIPSATLTGGDNHFLLRCLPKDAAP
ncbi:MAG TPA: transglutaminase domain-containing protein, partial [Vicinamibacteria bacterium]|nr:transglutaminase domain-containing protein [Vicinamibacteria bacterium]